VINNLEKAIVVGAKGSSEGKEDPGKGPAKKRGPERKKQRIGWKSKKEKRFSQGREPMAATGKGGGGGPCKRTRRRRVKKKPETTGGGHYRRK